MLEAVFLDGTDEVTAVGLTQWDQGQQLRITLASLPSAFQVHFGYKDSKYAYVVQATASGGVATVNIPNVVLQQSSTVTAWIYLVDGTARETVKTIKLPIVPRKQPSDYAYTEAEILDYTTVIAKMETEVNKASVSATTAQEAARTAVSAAADTVNLDHRITRNDKRIRNLEQRIDPQLYETDDGVAYIKDVPGDALPFAEITEIGGMTRKCENFISCAENFEFTKLASMAVNIPAGKYCLSTQGGTFGNLNRGCIRFYKNDKWLTLNADGGVSNVELTSEETQLYFYANGTALADSEGVTATISQLMLNKGSTALPYEPYFEGLRDVKVTAVESVGINIWDEVWEVGYIDANGNNLSGYTDRIRSTNYISCIADTTYFVVGNAILVNFYTANKEFISQGWKNSNASFTTPKNCRYLRFATNASYGGEYKYNICINEYNEAINGKYYPSIHNVISIPEAVQALEGYGQGISKDYCNKIVLDPASGVKKFVKRGSRKTITNVFDDTGTIYSNVKYYTIAKPSDAIDYNNYTTNFRIAGYEITDGNWDITANIGKMSGKANLVRYWFGFPVGTTLDEAKEALVGKEYEYALATPIETDISDYMHDDNFIGVEGGGTITAVNEHCFDAPTTITYMLKGGESA